MHFNKPFYCRFFTSFLLIIAVATGMYGSSPMRLPSSLPSLLKEFDATMKAHEYFIEKRQGRIDSLSRCFTEDISIERRLELVEALGYEYRGIQTDSAVGYFECGRNLALQVGLPSKALRLEALRCAEMPMRGEAHEAIAAFEALDPAAMDSVDLPSYYRAGSKLYFTIAGYYPDNEPKEQYVAKGVQHSLKLLESIPEDSLLYKYAAINLYYFQGKTVMMMAFVNDLLSCTTPDNEYYAIAARSLGTHLLEEDNVEEGIYYLALAAISELRTATLDGTALRRLGRALLDVGDHERGYEVLRLAMENASASGAKIRSMQTAEFAPLLTNHCKHKEQAIKWWFIWLWLLLANSAPPPLMGRP
ncbi:MAG: hypothetical protein LIO90_00735 [Bacteroidales bacterium]|nr:hypothetical protein [Bacteroidales bacterium]